MIKELKKIPSDISQWDEWHCTYAAEPEHLDRLVLLYATCDRKDKPTICYIPGACKLIEWDCPAGLSFNSEVLIPFVPLWTYGHWAEGKVDKKKYTLVHLVTDGSGFYSVVPAYLRP